MAERLPAEVTDVLWGEYQAKRTTEARDELIIAYSPLVRFVASRVGANLPSSVEVGDLISFGMFGLLDAIERFEPDRGFKFETFAIPRVKGAILDELRAMDWVPRSVRAKARAIERAIVTFEVDNGRSPTEDELADVMGQEVTSLQRSLSEVSAGGLAALDEVRATGEGELGTLRDLLADTGSGPDVGIEERETRQLLRGFVNALPDREKAVLTLYYFERLTMADIGDVLGVTESRVCQIHAKAVLALRSKFNASWR